MDNVVPVEAAIPIVPKAVPVGTSVLLMEIGDAARIFPNRSHRQLLYIMELFGVPLIHDKEGRVFFNLYSLEKVLNYVTRVGGRGFALPGSNYRDCTLYREKAKRRAREGEVLAKVGEKEREEMNSFPLEVERLATGPRAPRQSKQSYIAALREIDKKKCQNQ